MNLLELAARRQIAPDFGVPVWALGCFRRRSIAFFDGLTDTATLVFWLQTRGSTFDLRLAPDRPRPESAGALLHCSGSELALLAEAEGGIARTTTQAATPPENAALLLWHDWDAFQPYDKWPEPGFLRRVGDCLIEFAPSGAYVEDWRYKTAGPGPLIGLRLLEERDLDTGSVRHAGGGLVICGDHAGFVRGRARQLPANQRPADLVRASPRDRELLGAVFGFEASYARRTSSGDFVITASTLPWREGAPLIALDGFSAPDSEQIVVQSVREHGVRLERHFRAETLEASFVGVESTRVSAEGAAWLVAERGTLCSSANRIA